MNATNPEDLARIWFSPDQRAKVQVLHALLGRPRRFSDIRRLADITHDNQVTTALDILKNEALVRRLVVAKGPQGVEYEITPRGIEVWNEWYVLYRVNFLGRRLGTEVQRVNAITGALTEQRNVHSLGVMK